MTPDQLTAKEIKNVADLVAAISRTYEPRMREHVIEAGKTGSKFPVLKAYRFADRAIKSMETPVPMKDFIEQADALDPDLAEMKAILMSLDPAARELLAEMLGDPALMGTIAAVGRKMWNTDADRREALIQTALEWLAQAKQDKEDAFVQQGEPSGPPEMMDGID